MNSFTILQCQGINSRIKTLKKFTADMQITEDFLKGSYTL